LSTQSGPVRLQAAADLAGVDVNQIRRWADIGGVEIQRRGGMETVAIEQVVAMSASARRLRAGYGRDSLRARLADGKVQKRSISDLE
jgi:hypothetical protein